MADEEVTPDEVQGTMDSFYEELWTENTELATENRKAALKCFALAEKYDELAALARELGTLHLVHTTVLGSALSDLLEGQFSLTVVNEAIGEDEDDDPEDDD